MAELTGWYPSTQKPAYAGWYDIRCANFTIFGLRRWRYDGRGHWNDEGGWPRVEQFEWRGSTEPIHAANCATNAPPDVPTGPCDCFLAR